MSLNSITINKPTDYTFDEPSMNIVPPSSPAASSTTDFDTIISRSIECDSFLSSPIYKPFEITCSSSIIQIDRMTYNLLKDINNTRIIECDSKDILEALNFFLTTCDISYSYDAALSTFAAQACYPFGLVEFSISLSNLSGTNIHIIHFINGRGSAIIGINIFIQLQNILLDITYYNTAKPIYDINAFNHKVLHVPKIAVSPLTDSEKATIVLYMTHRLTTPYDEIIFDSLEGLLSYAQPENPLYDTFATSGVLLNKLFDIICSRHYSVQSMTLAAYILAQFLEAPDSSTTFADYCHTTRVSFKQIHDYLTLVSTSSGAFFTRLGFQEIYDYQTEYLRHYSASISSYLSFI